MTTPSIADFRLQVRAVLARRPACVIVLAIDGVPYDLACRVWRRAHITRARSVFPTTSATAWLSALSGATVDSHGIPGVVFEHEGQLIDVYKYAGPLGEPPSEDLFSDAARAGYTPIAIVGDLEDTHCTWRELLLHRAQQVRGHTFFSRLEGPLDPKALAARLMTAVDQAVTKTPCLVWCFIDADRYIHHHGYDRALLEFLERVDAIADDWTRDDRVVMAHSDHGLVPTHHDATIASTLDRVIAAHGCRMGGAGRTRWLYVAPEDEGRVRDELTRSLPASVEIRHADELFAPGSLARRRVGSIVLIAKGPDFLAADGYTFEHGSLTDGEVDVGVAEW